MPRSDGYVATRLEALEQLGGLSKRADPDVEPADRVDVGCLCDALVGAHAAGLTDGAPTTAEGRYELTDPAQTIPAQIPAGLASDLIRRLFATGLHLASLQSLLGDSALSGKAAAAVEELDDLIRDIRTAALEQT